MQVIVHVDLTVESYVEEQYAQRMRRPDLCGNCGEISTLKVLGYYSRYTTGVDGNAVYFKVARFICKACGLTTSCLPSFAQPYRLAGTGTVEAYICREHCGLDVQRLEGLLKRYVRQIDRWHKYLCGIVGSRFGRAPPKENATAFVRRAVAACGSLAELTLRLVQEFRATCFGTYRCHQTTFAN